MIKVYYVRKEFVLNKKIYLNLKIIGNQAVYRVLSKFFSTFSE